MIILNDISKKFDQTAVLSNINLKIREGEIVGLLGPNGAGKTTTLRIISGILPPTQGRLTINGLDFKNHEKQIKKLIGYLPENNPLYDDITVEEHLHFWAKLKGIRGKKLEEAIDFVVENTGIAEVYFRPIFELSKGYRQRVGLSQAILDRPNILVLDEPTEGLDPNQRQEITSLIKNLGKRRTVVVSSHVLSEIAKICNRIVIINNGKIVADDSPENLKKSKGTAVTVKAEILGENVIPVLKSINGIIGATKLRTNYYLVKSAKGFDPRKKIFQTAITKKWTVLTLVKKERELEEVFAQLTSD